MEQEETKNIEDIINGFIKEMNNWEIYCNELENENLDSAEEDRLQKEKATIIFNTYCTQKERKYGLPNCISYGTKGSYKYDSSDEKITHIEKLKPSRIEVKTERKKPMEEQLIYILLKKKGEWLIDSKKRYSSWKEKWENSIL